MSFFNLRHPRDFISPTSRKGTLYHIYIYGVYKCVFVTLWHFLLFRPQVFPRALGSVAHREPARTPYASLGSGRGLWRVLWGFKVERPLGEAFRARRAIRAHANPRTHAHQRLRVSADSAASQFALLSKHYTSQTPSAPRHLEIFYMLESLMR